MKIADLPGVEGYGVVVTRRRRRAWDLASQKRSLEIYARVTMLDV